ncbi:hypothetical protein ACFVIM_14790 [Streptomyces sp. NPDC057638]|uniref:hypothetical protein n=1 Tax=Streptomyces sp. NPDC057638 TaxID=3346190 RepID=UPI003676CE26
MGGRRHGLSALATRPTALLGAVATLLGALFLCLTPPDDHHPATATASPSAPVVAYSCPYEKGACGIVPVAAPAVLTAPPPDTPTDAGEPAPRPDRLAAPGGPDRSEVRARAPDLHVLQVLRT